MYETAEPMPPEWPELPTPGRAPLDPEGLSVGRARTRARSDREIENENVLTVRDAGGAGGPVTRKGPAWMRRPEKQPASERVAR